MGQHETLIAYCARKRNGIILGELIYCAAEGSTCAAAGMCPVKSRSYRDHTNTHAMVLISQALNSGSIDVLKEPKIFKKTLWAVLSIYKKILWTPSYKTRQGRSPLGR